MIRLLIYYSIATVFLAGIDWYRRKKQMGKVVNIDHAGSVVMAIVAWLLVMAIYVLKNAHPELQGWLVLLWYLTNIIGCIGVRLLIYDFVLNLFFGRKLTDTSTTTDSYKDTHTNHLPFWVQRLIGAAMISVCLIVNYLWL